MTLNAHSDSLRISMTLNAHSYSVLISMTLNAHSDSVRISMTLNAHSDSHRISMYSKSDAICALCGPICVKRCTWEIVNGSIGLRTPVGSPISLGDCPHCAVISLFGKSCAFRVQRKQTFGDTEKAAIISVFSVSKCVGKPRRVSNAASFLAPSSVPPEKKTLMRT